MKSWTVVICLMVSQLAELGCGKRFDPAMVDPLMRRSSLDKNFMRFGRSSPSYEEKEDAEEESESPPGADTNKEDSFLRSMRGKDNNFMRFGRGRNDNYMRFGRGKQDSFMRFGRARNDNYMRFGRGKDNNFMRFGRGKEGNFMRFGRGREDNYMRFGRGKEDNFMRFGRGKQDNFMRFGRGKQDNFMRFGKGVNYGKTDSFMRLGRGKQGNFMRFGRNPSENLSNIFADHLNAEDAALRFSRGRQNNLMRFGKKSDEDPIDEVPIEIRSINPKQNFMRFGRGKQDNFMRFGKSDDGKNSLQTIEDEDNKDSNYSLNNPLLLVEDVFTRDIKSKDLNQIRLGRHPLNTNNAFIRFGRSSQTQVDETDPTNELIPPRLKRSVLSDDSPDELFQSDYRQDVNGFYTSLPGELEEEFVTPVHQEDYSSRKKRSLPPVATTSPLLAEDSVVDYISAKLSLRSSKPEYESSLLSAGLPNVIGGPEFSLLPDLDPPASMLKRGRPGDKSFLRLG